MANSGSPLYRTGTGDYSLGLLVLEMERLNQDLRKNNERLTHC